MKMKNHKFLIAALVTLVLAAGCTLFESKPDIAAPSAPSVTVGHEEMAVSWNPVENAKEYILFVSEDGSEVSDSSTKVYSGTNTAYTHLNLDSEKEYRYALRYVTAEGTSSISSSTSANIPEPVFHLYVTFDGYANQDVGYQIIHLEENDTSIIKARLVGDGRTDASGFFEVTQEVDRGKWYGFTVFKDTDDSGELSSGDIVWGSGNGFYSYLHIPASKPVTESVHFTIEKWSEVIDSITINTF